MESMEDVLKSLARWSLYLWRFLDVVHFVYFFSFCSFFSSNFLGKTSISFKALAHIFGFGHTQSDDVHVKKPAPGFVKNVFNLLNTHDVVIVDK